MAYQKIELGALYIDSIPQVLPRVPNVDGDMLRHIDFSAVSIGKAVQGVPPITWIQPSGMNILVADRVLFTNASWEALDKAGVIFGREVIVEGTRFFLRSLKVGTSVVAPNEWDQCLNATSDSDELWHWKKAAFWGQEVDRSTEKARVIRGYDSAQYWFSHNPEERYVGVGFRPVLDIVLSWDIAKGKAGLLEGQEFTLLQNKTELALVPTENGRVLPAVFEGIPFGQTYRMGTLLVGGRPVRPDDSLDSGRRNARIELTDQYFGDEYLIPWTVKAGFALTECPLLATARREITVAHAR